MMTEYILEIKRQFKEKYNFKPIDPEECEPRFDNIPTGVYPMKLFGKIYDVVVDERGIDLKPFQTA